MVEHTAIVPRREPGRATMQVAFAHGDRECARNALATGLRDPAQVTDVAPVSMQAWTLEQRR